MKNFNEEYKTPFLLEIEKYRRIEDDGQPESDRRYAARLGVAPTMLRMWRRNASIPRLDTVRNKIVPGLKLTPAQARVMMDLAAELATGHSEYLGRGLEIVDSRPQPDIHPSVQKTVDEVDFMVVPAMSDTFQPIRLKLSKTSTKSVEALFNKLWLQSVASAPENVFKLEITDETMAPTLRQYDTAFVDSGERIIRNDKIYAFAEGSSVVVRRFKHRADHSVKAVCDNVEVMDRSSLWMDQKSVQIIGQVIWVSRILI